MDPKPPLNPVLLSRARAMRSEPALAERKLWARLRNRKLGGFKFRRQHPVGVYVADFYCDEVKLIVELDGESHEVREVYDETRTKLLWRDGCWVIRFANPDVYRFTEGVLSGILRECEALRASGAPSPRSLRSRESKQAFPAWAEDLHGRNSLRPNEITVFMKIRSWTSDLHEEPFRPLSGRIPRFAPRG